MKVWKLFKKVFCIDYNPPNLIPRTCPKCFYHFWSPPDVKVPELCSKCKSEQEIRDKLRAKDSFANKMGFDGISDF